MIDNKTVFSAVEFDSWAHRSRLIKAEQHLIERYLDKNGQTLEAGTGGGKILFAMKALGFERLAGFDFVPRFIQQAKKRDTTASIGFAVNDAVNLGYLDSSFDQVIYLQQIICFLEEEHLRVKALEEGFRILRPGGTALFSFLSFDVRSQSLRYSAYLTYLSALRSGRRSKATIQHTPWLKLGGKFNVGSILDKGPYVYWYRTTEVCDLLRSVGFRITAIGSSHQIEQGEMCESPEALEKEPINGMLYAVCTK